MFCTKQKYNRKFSALGNIICNCSCFKSQHHNSYSKMAVSMWLLPWRVWRISSTFLFCLQRAAWWFAKLADLQIYIRAFDIVCNWVLSGVIQICFRLKCRQMIDSYTIRSTQKGMKWAFHLSISVLYKGKVVPF